MVKKGLVSYGVMLTEAFGGLDFYQVACGCGDKDCNMVIEIEYNEESKRVYLSFYKDICLSIYWHDENWFKRQWRRIKYAARILFTGFVKMEEVHIFKDPEHVEAFIKVLEYGKGEMERARISQDSNDLQEGSIDEI